MVAPPDTRLTPQARRLFWVLAVVALVTVLPEIRSANDASRMALTQALVEHGTLAIDATPFVRDPDKVLIGGHFYSDKPATPSLLAALVYGPLAALGVRLDYGLNLAYYLVVLLVSKTAWWGGALAAYKSLRLADVPERARLAATAALALGSLYLTYSAVFANHGLAAAAIAGGWYAYRRAARGGAGIRAVAASGGLLGLAGAADFPVLVYALGVAALLAVDGRLRRGLPIFLGCAAVAMLPGVAVNYAISGSVVPVQLVPEYFAWPGSPWTPDQLTGSGRHAGWDLVRYAAACLVGPRGFLVYNPLLLPALALILGRLAGLRRGRPEARDALVVLVATAVLWGYYVVSSTNFSGYSYSVRWFVPSLVLLLPFLAHGWRFGRPWRVLFWTLLPVSVVIALVGCLNPWSNIAITDVVFAANLIERWPGLGDLLPR